MNEFLDWLRNDTAGLLLLAGAGIALLLFLIIKVKLEPFIALVGTGVLVALVGGISVEALVGSATKSSDALIEKGFAGILGHITVIIGLGTVLGAILERSGGAEVLLGRLVKIFGEKGTPLAMGITGFVLGIPCSSTSASSCSHRWCTLRRSAAASPSRCMPCRCWPASP